MNNIAAIVRCYIKNNRSRATEELNWFRQQPTIASAIFYAAISQDNNGKRYRHQQRITNGAITEAKQILLSNSKLFKKSRDFDELFELINEILKPVKGVGELYVYDTSLRIGAKLNQLPTKVYLHAGTKKGAEALGFSKKIKVLEVSCLPKEFYKLEPHEIEDVLCIFKSKFGNDADLKMSVECAKPRTRSKNY